MLINGNEIENTIQANILRSYTHTIDPKMGQKVKTNSEEGHVAYQFKGKEV